MEVRHGFEETHREPCPVCAGALTRVINPAPIIFKGSGFYVTDSRGKGKKDAAPTEPATKAESTKAESNKTDATPSTPPGTTAPAPSKESAA